MSDNNRTAAMSGLLAGNETLAKVSDVEYSKVQSYFEMLEGCSKQYPGLLISRSM